MNPKQIKEIIVSAIQSDMAREQRYIDIHGKVLEAAAAFDGKKVTRRIATAVEKLLSDYTVAYSSDYGMYHVSVWGNGIEYGERYSALLAYHSPSRFSDTGGVFDLELFDTELSSCYGKAARERQAKRRALLADDGQLFDIAVSYHGMLVNKAGFDAAMGDTLSNASYYAIRSALNADNWMK